MAKEKRKLAMLVIANALTGDPINGWLKSYDPDAEEGRGSFETTDDRDEAMQFDSVQDLHACWTQTSTVNPMRSDGKPNRPLTAYTVEARPVERETGERWGGHRRYGGADVDK